jgi:hypothetical protein
MSLVTSSPTKWKGIDSTKKIAGEGFKREWPLLIKIDVKSKVKKML